MLEGNNIFEEFDIFSTDEELMYSDVVTDIAAEITTYRAVNNLTQKELGDSIGNNQSYISKLENGEKNLSIKTLSEISTKLGGNLKISLGIADFKMELKKHETFYESKDFIASKAVISSTKEYDKTKEVICENQEMALAA